MVCDAKMVAWAPGDMLACMFACSLENRVFMSMYEKSHFVQGMCVRAHSVIAASGTSGVV